MADYPVVDVDLSQKVGPPTSHFTEIDELREKYRYFWNSSAQGYWVLTRFEDMATTRSCPPIPLPPTGFCRPTLTHRST
jgi:hypothetical protein